MRIGAIEREVSPLCLGGNVFGWTADEGQSFAVLDAYVEAGGNFIDTANSYSDWVEGHRGGESETILGRWLARRGSRDDLIVATKIGDAVAAPGLSAPNVVASVDASLARLGVERIDLLYAHSDDETVPLEETLGAFAEVVSAGKVAEIAASNYSSARLSEALACSRAHGWPSYRAVQTHYNLVHRHEFEDDQAELCRHEGIRCVAYSALADGFLTGKHRRGGPAPTGVRADDVIVHLTSDREPVLETLDGIAAERGVPVAAIALAWLIAQDGVIALASARNPEQLAELLPALELSLSSDEVTALSAVTAKLDDIVV